jgi:hypothetical protein
MLEDLLQARVNVHILTDDTQESIASLSAADRRDGTLWAPCLRATPPYCCIRGPDDTRSMSATGFSTLNPRLLRLAVS